MKKLFSIVFIFGFFIFNLFPQNNQTVKIGYYEYSKYMEGISEEKNRSGYVYEYLQEIAILNDWNYEYIYGSFPDLCKMLEEGAIDILPCMLNLNPSNHYLISEQSIKEEAYCIIGHNERYVEYNDDFSSYNNKTVGVVKNCLMEKILQKWFDKNHISMRINYYNTFEDNWNAFNNNQIDYIVSTDSFAQIKPCTICLIDNQDVYIGFSNSKENIKKQFDESVQTLEKIKPFKKHHLINKYFSNSLSFYALSEIEKEYVGVHRKIKLGVLNTLPPYSYLDSSNKLHGVIVDFIETILKNLNLTEEIDIEWIMYDKIGDLQNALKNNEVDVIFPEINNHALAEEKNAYISDKIVALDMSILYKGNYFDETIKTIAVNGTNLDLYYCKENYPDSKLILCTDVHDCIKKIKEGKACCAIANLGELRKAAGNLQEPYHIEDLSIPVEICFETKNNNKPLILLLNRGLKTVSTNEMREFKNKNSENYEKEITIFTFLKTNLLFTIVIILVLCSILIILIVQSFYTRKIKLANNAKNNFLFNMSHDIRTPMNAIIGFTHMAVKNLDNKKKVENYLRKVKISSNHLMAILNKILDMSQIEMGTIKLTEDTVDISKCAEYVNPMLEELASTKKINFTFEIRNIKDCFVLLDVVHFNQVLIDLVTNAIQYTEEGGSVIASISQMAEKHGNYAIYKIEVEDNGIGIDNDYLKHIFEDNNMRDSSVIKEYQGNGLGLPLCKKIVSAMGGTIKAVSEKDLGSKFTITLPLKIVENVEPSAIKIPDEIQLHFEARRVLIVDDNEYNREITNDILSDVGLLVDEAIDGNDCLEKLELNGEYYYDFILMDIQMPEMNGYETAKKIRNMFPNHHIPIVALSANAFEDDIRKSIESGMDSHLAKPVNINLLYTTIKKFLDE